jgi:CheY-like chemotaxis protein
MSPESGILKLLLIDDDPDDRTLFATALHETGLAVELTEATDGYAALNYLFGRGQYADRAKFPLPDLIFLDLKMPGIDGFGVLKEIRSNRELKHLPILVLTNSNLKSDAVASYALGANAIHQKPVHFRGLVHLLQAVISPWLNRGLRNFQQKPKHPV